MDEHADRLRVVALAAGENAERLAEQIVKYRPAVVAMASAAATHRLRCLGPFAGTTIATPGPEGLAAVATAADAELVLCASSGTDALEAVLAAIDRGRTIGLANKEILVMAGALVTAAARRSGVTILPVDSEHNAIHQCLRGCRPGELKRLVLTASGGPFRGRSGAELERVTADEALRHPTWRMGRKITIDSATLMNKGLEVIEAKWLFDVSPAQIDVVLHPQSIVHSMIELTDGSVIAQMGTTDMRLPIQYAFSFPDRWTTSVPPLDLARAGTLEFHAADTAAFPCLDLAYRALEGGASLPIVLNAANEVAVARFLRGQLSFTAIPRLIERAMDAHRPVPVDTLADVRAVDGWARLYAAELAHAVESKV